MTYLKTVIDYDDVPLEVTYEPDTSWDDMLQCEVPDVLVRTIEVNGIDITELVRKEVKTHVEQELMRQMAQQMDDWADEADAYDAMDREDVL